MGFDPYSNDEQLDLGQYSGDAHVAPLFRQTVDWQAECIAATVAELARASTGKRQHPVYVDANGEYHVSRYAKPLIRRMFELLYLPFHVSNTESFLGEPCASVTLDQMAADIAPWSEAWGDRSGAVKPDTLGKQDFDAMGERLPNFERYRKGVLGRASLYRVTRDEDGGAVQSEAYGTDPDEARKAYVTSRDEFRASCAADGTGGARGKCICPQGQMHLPQRREIVTYGKLNPSEGAGNPSEAQGNPSESGGNPSELRGNTIESEGNPSEAGSNPSEATRHGKVILAAQAAISNLGEVGAHSDTTELPLTVPTIGIPTSALSGPLSGTIFGGESLGNTPCHGTGDEPEAHEYRVTELVERLSNLNDEGRAEEVTRIASTHGPLRIYVDYFGCSHIVGDVVRARRGSGLPDVEWLPRYAMGTKNARRVTKYRKMVSDYARQGYSWQEGDAPAVVG